MNKKVDKADKKIEVKKTEIVKKESSFKKKKKVKRNITSGIAYVYSTFNNTIISIADESYISIARSVLPEAVDPKIKTIDFLILFFFIRLLR